MLQRRFILILLGTVTLLALIIFLWKEDVLWHLTRPHGHAPTFETGNSKIAPSTTAITASAPTSNPNALEVQAEKYVSAYRTPISFYGKVIDQNNDPVANAEVVFYIKSRPMENSVSRKSGTDSRGLFALEGTSGLSLSVEVSKAGYRVIPPGDANFTSSGSFQYGVGTHRFTPERENPIILRLFKMGSSEKLVIIGPKDIIVPDDGNALSISLDEQGKHRVTLRCWNKWAELKNNEYKYDWRVEIIVEDGELTRRTNSFAFEAPEIGYSAGEAIEMPASEPRWDSVVERSYFFHFKDGTFGRANLRMRAARNTFVVWQSFFNPKPGSRNLESDAPKGRLDF